MSCRSDDELRTDDVMNAGDAVDKTFGFNEAKEVVSVGGPDPGDIELPMTKHLAAEVETHPSPCLPLRLVNGHCIAQTNRELQPVESNTTGSCLNVATYTQYFDKIEILQV